MKRAFFSKHKRIGINNELPAYRTGRHELPLKRNNFRRMKKLLILLLWVFPVFTNAQKFEYQVRFEGITDNREYFNPIAYAQTIMGSRGAFEVGIEIDQHRIRGGLSQLYEFGSDLDLNKPKLTMYYQYVDEKRELLFGAFPRAKRINFPFARLTDTVLYYRPNIEGLFYESRWNWGKENIFIDWTSRQTDFNRENFLVGFSGEVFYKNLFVENHILLFHNMGPRIDIPGDHIKDYLGFAVRAGVRTNETSQIKATLKAGALGSSFRERSVTNGFINATSLFAEANARYKNYGIKTVLSSGGSHKFAFGDRFYGARNYMRTDLIWYFVNHEKVKGRINYAFHFIDWEDIDQQQQLSLIYVFGN